MICHLHLDFETRHEQDLKDIGLDNYVRTAEVQMLAWAINDQAPQIWVPDSMSPADRARFGYALPEDLAMYLRSEAFVKVAWNAGFERAILLHVLGIDVPWEQWVDPAAFARYAGIGSSLAKAGEVLGLPEDAAKAKRGKQLMRMFAFSGKRGFRTPEQAPDEFADYQEYCKQDVRAEREVLRLIYATFKLPERERQIFRLDRKINERGIPVDMVFVENAQKIVATEKARIVGRMKELTGLDNPNSCKQLLGWLKPLGYPFGSLGAKWVTNAIAGVSIDEHEADPSLAAPKLSTAALEALQLRQMLAKSSTKKLDALAERVSPDGRIRYNYKFYGAHTGRWAGEGAQLQNLPRGTIENVAEASEAIRNGGMLRQFGNTLDVVSSCLRSAFRAPAGQRFVVCDLSTIEVRVLAWLSGCASLQGVFARGEDPYIAFASEHLYRIPQSDVTKRQRQIAKSAVLGCGFQLSGGEEREDKNGDVFKSGLWGYAANMGCEMSQEEAHAAVDAFRGAYREVVRFWYNAQDAAIKATLERSAVECSRVTFMGKGKLLAALLPAGRRLHYIRPQVEENGAGRLTLSYWGVNAVTKQWGCRPTYGGHLTENLVQAIARDVLAEGMLRADRENFEIVGHTHDEIIALAEDKPTSCHNLAVLRSLMTEPMPWAPDLPLAADGYEGQVYKK